MTNNIHFSRESSPDTVYLEDFISFQADVKDLDIFPEELTDYSSNTTSPSPEQEQELSSCASSPSVSICSKDSTSGSQPASPFTQIKNNFTIPRTSPSPSSFNNFNNRNSLCDHHHSILCTVCSSSKPALHTEAHLLHQPPGVVAQLADSTVHQAPTHSPSLPLVTWSTSHQSPRVEYTPLVTTEKSPRAERRSPTVLSPETVTTKETDQNKCSHHLLPKCYNCGNCLCCLLIYNKEQLSVIKASCSSDSPSLFKPLTIDIPEIAPFNTYLKSPSSNKSLNTPVCEISPDTLQPVSLFSSGTTTTKKKDLTVPRLVFLFPVYWISRSIQHWILLPNTIYQMEGLTGLTADEKGKCRNTDGGEDAEVCFGNNLQGGKAYNDNIGRGAEAHVDPDEERMLRLMRALRVKVTIPVFTGAKSEDPITFKTKALDYMEATEVPVPDHVNEFRHCLEGKA